MSEDASTQARRSALFRKIAWGVVVLATALLVPVALLQPEIRARTLGIAATIDVLCLVLLEVNRRGWTRTASALLVGGLLLRVTLNSIQQGGIRSPGISLYLVLAMMAGLLLGEQAGLWTAGAGLAAALGFAAAEFAGVLPAQTVTFSAPALFALNCIYMGVAIVLLRLYTRELADDLKREKELREELVRLQEVKDLFGLFVTPAVAEHVMRLAPEKRRAVARRTVTMLFVDVRSFTPYAESVEPELAVETLNTLFDGVVGAIQAEGGVLNKFMGDGLLAIFGAPLDVKDHEMAAARAALSAQQSLLRFTRERSARGLPSLQIGIGINTGPVVAGCLGTSDRTEYTVIGHAVNLAARLESAALPGQILIGPDTMAALGDAFLFKDETPMSLQGVAAPVMVRELMGHA